MTTFFARPDRLDGPLHVLTSVFNPARYRSRWKLWEDFARRMPPNAVLHTVEVAFGERAFVTDAELKLRAGDELWLKEAALNLIAQRLPSDWKYVAWIDADVRFLRDDWADETLHALQRYDVVQPWSVAWDLSADYEPLRSFRSFAWSYRHPEEAEGAGPYHGAAGAYWHPGFAWACTRRAWDTLGGLIDWAILGGGDLFMARALTGVRQTRPQSLGASGRARLAEWTRRARQLHGNVGWVPGTLAHYWHGSKANRRYRDRGQVLVDARFEPDRDLVKDWQGLWRLAPGNPKLRDGIRAYFDARREDES